MNQVSPRPNRPPRERLASIKDPNGARAIRRPSRRPQITCPECNSTNIEDLDGTQVCTDCGTTLNDSNIVAEVTFGESAAGAAVVQGGFVGEGARHANTLGPAFRRAGGGMESREVTQKQGRDEIRRQANGLNLTDSIADQAFSIYKLAANANFIQGRRVNVVAAVCLYIACRRDRNNQTLLMDFSEAISVNVFKLGQAYQDLKKALIISDSDSLGIRPVIDVENLILKFARKLEFGSSLYKVAEDAAKIMRRMKRDWMVTGRRPSGLCGACIILAARMNNFRRTVREVVYIVKVADVTVAKRLEEFTNTRSSNLTVDQFREIGLRLKMQHDPPSVYERRAREEEKRRREQEIAERDGEESSAGNNPQSPAAGGTAEAPSTEQQRRDADGFAIPALPIDPNILPTTRSPPDIQTTSEDVAEGAAEESDPAEPPLKKRKYNKRSKAQRPAIEISEDDLAVEADLEDEMEQILNDSSLFSEEQSAFIEAQSQAKANRDVVPAQVNQPANDSVMVDLGNANTDTTAPLVSNDPEIAEDEFDDDPEVSNCLLSEEERRIKERIWVTHNEDWLRAQQAKILKKALEEANGGSSTKPRKKRKKGRMGDGSLLEGGTPVEDAADATARMLEKRANQFSKHINYDKLSKFYAGLRGTGSRGARTEEATETTESEAVEEERSSAGDSGVPERRADLTGALPTPAPTQDKESEGRRREKDDEQAVGGRAEDDEAEDDENWDVDDEEEEELDDNEDMEAALDDLAYAEDDYDLGFGGEEPLDDY